MLRARIKDFASNPRFLRPDRSKVVFTVGMYWAASSTIIPVKQPFDRPR
jgi:hypothetical protein